ncbi:MAG: Ppx/GppA phosphatase family protein [Robiginitomaculum sp.]
MQPKDGLEKEPFAFTLKRIGVLDIGSNSVRLVIYEIYGAAFTPIYNEKVLAGLGRDLKTTGRLHVAGAKMALTALKRFKLLTDALGLDKVLIAATAALRDAQDAGAFITQVKADTGFDIKPLSGETEAYMTAMGVIAGDYRARGLVADLGGASLEFMSIENGKAGTGVSYPLGPFSMFKDMFTPQDLKHRILDILKGSSLGVKGKTLYLIGGAWRNLALIHQKNIGYPLRVAHNYKLEPNAAKTLARWAYSDKGAQTFGSINSLSKRRADTLPYSGLMLEILLDKLQPFQVILAPGGLREGLVFNALDPKTQSRNALFDACRALALGNQKAIRFSTPLYNFLYQASSIFPKAFESKNENRLRMAACLLVGIGKGFHPAHKAKLVFRTIISAPLPDLTHKERAYLALILYTSYTSKSATPNDAAIGILLSEEERLSARIYGQAMRAGVVLSGRSRTILSKFKLAKTASALSLQVEAGFDALFSGQSLSHVYSFEKLSNINVHIIK